MTSLFSSHAQWTAEDEGGAQECLSSLSELPSKRSIALHGLHNGGEVCLLSSPTALQHDPSCAVLDTSCDITSHKVPVHAVSHSSWKLELNTLSPAKNPNPTRFIEVRHHRSPKEIQEKHYVMWMFRLVPEVAGFQHCNTNQSLLPMLWARVQLYKSTYTVCYTFCIKRITELLSYISTKLYFIFQSLSQIWC